jgi:hypothetical protein
MGGGARAVTCGQWSSPQLARYGAACLRRRYAMLGDRQGTARKKIRLRKNKKKKKKE